MSIWLVTSVQMCNVCCKTTKALRPTQSLVRPLFNKFIPFHITTIQWHIIRIFYSKYLNPRQNRNVRVKWNCAENKRANISKHTIIRFRCLISWLVRSIRIYSLAGLYNLKANKTNFYFFSKYFEVYMIQKDDSSGGHSLQSKCEVRKWKHVIWDQRLSHPPDRLSILYGSRDQPQPGYFLQPERRGKSLGTRLNKHNFIFNYEWYLHCRKTKIVFYFHAFFGLCPVFVNQALVIKYKLFS